jgi:hypothetical protein
MLEVAVAPLADPYTPIPVPLPWTPQQFDPLGQLPTRVVALLPEAVKDHASPAELEVNCVASEPLFEVLPSRE